MRAELLQAVQLLVEVLSALPVLLQPTEWLLYSPGWNVTPYRAESFADKRWRMVITREKI